MEAKMREMALREEEDSEAVEEQVEEDMEAYIRDAFSSAGFSEQDFAKPGSFTSTELPEQCVYFLLFHFIFYSNLL